jgi:hypothetical protein
MKHLIGIPLQQNVHDDPESLKNPLATEEEPKFVAPYFPFIQSSDMGKTKLLHELSIFINGRKETRCHLILPGFITQTRRDVL